MNFKWINCLFESLEVKLQSSFDQGNENASIWIMDKEGCRIDALNKNYTTPLWNLCVTYLKIPDCKQQMLLESGEDRYKKKKKKGLSVFNSNFQLFITLLLSGIKKIYLNRHCMSEDKLVFSPWLSWNLSRMLFDFLDELEPFTCFAILGAFYSKCMLHTY